VRFTGPFLVMTAAGAADLRTRMLDFRADPRLVASAGTPGEAPRDIGVPVVIQGPWSAPRIYADTPNILANPETALRALRDALGGRRSKGSQTDAPLGKLIEGLSKGLGKSDGATSRDGGGIAEDMLKALGGARGGEAPQSERTAPDPDVARPSSKPPPEQDLERRARISTGSARALSGTSFFQDCDRVLGRPPEGGSRAATRDAPVRRVAGSTAQPSHRLDRSRAGKAGRPAGI